MPDNPKTYECDTGIILTQDENGQYLPFIMKTRTQDTIYPNSNFTDEFLKKLLELGCTEIEKFYPSPSYHFNLDSWNCKLTDGKHLVASKEIHINNIDDEFELRETIEAIYYEENILRFERRFYNKSISLPFTFEREGFSIDATLNAFSNEIKSSILSIDTSTESIDEIANVGLSMVVNAVPEDRSEEVMEYDGNEGLRIFSRYLETYNEGIVFNDDLEVGYPTVKTESTNRLEELDGVYIPSTSGPSILEYNEDLDAVLINDDDVSYYGDGDGVSIDESVMNEQVEDDSYDESIYIGISEHSTISKQFSIFIRIEGDISDMNIFDDMQSETIPLE